LLFDLLDEILEEMERKERYLIVHCTHGVNRTGYLLVLYMNQRLSIPIQDAISDFQTARNELIENELYLKHLKQLQ
jgi:atypical dual specificity phosphatase